MIVPQKNAQKKISMHCKEIRCRDERTYALLKDFCEKTDVKIRIYEHKMAALDDAEMALLDQTLGGDEDDVVDQMTEMVEAILSMSKAELKTMPKQLVAELRMLIAHDVFPKDIAAELENKLKGI